MFFRLTFTLMLLFGAGLSSFGQDETAIPLRRSGMAVIVAFPEKNIPLPTDPTVWNKMARLFDFDHDDHWRVGHGGLLLIDKNSGNVEYVDYGRYDDRTDLADPRPENYGVVRTPRYVPELKLKTLAHFSDGHLINLDTLLIELSSKHIFDDYGIMEAAVYDDLYLGRIWDFVHEKEEEGYIRYGCPTHQYCTRFVRQVIRKGGGRYGFGIYTGKQMIRWHEKNF